MATPCALRALDDQTDRQVLLPGNWGYDAARTVENATIDRQPRLIVGATGVGDMIGVRCGGHAVPTAA